MADLNKSFAGIRCREVLALLSVYLDGELGAEERRQIEAHLAECDRCERFGGRFGAAVAALRRELAREDALDPRVATRLRARLVAL